MISGCADTHPSSVLHKGRSGGSPQEHQPSTMQGTVSLWHHLRVTRLSHRVCPWPWPWPLLSRAGRGWMSLPEHWAGQPRVPSPGRALSGSPPSLGKRAAPEGTRHGPISAPRMRGGGAARWRSWRSECGVAGGVRGMRDPPPSAGCGGTGGTEMGQGCDRVVTGLFLSQAEAADPAGAGELAEEEEGVPGHQGHPGQAGAAQQAQGTAGPSRARARSPSSTSGAGNRNS